MEKSNSHLLDLIHGLPTQACVNQLMLAWQKTLPTHISDLFTRETVKGIERYDTFQLKPEYVSFLVNELNHPKGNIKTISVIMGKGKSEEKPTSDNGPTQNIFKPVLEVVLCEAYSDANGKKRNRFYFDLEPMGFLLSVLPPLQTTEKLKPLDTDQQISPKVAELFILKWQSLTDGEVINAFEGLAADSISHNIDPGSQENDIAEIVFRVQKIRRVKKYTYDPVETQAIMKVLKESKKPEFFVNLGAGLTVPDFHPFNFRPIIRIVSQPGTGSTSAKPEEDDPGTSYFDTSKPCPPFCSG